MKITLVHPRDLTPDLISDWRSIQRADQSLWSPYFCPEFTQAVAAVRDDVYVAILEDAGCVGGFFPFQRGRFGIGCPVGGALSDFHGLVATSPGCWKLAYLLRSCRLTSFEYHHLVAAQTLFQPYNTSIVDSHYIDLADGFEGYVAYLRATGSHLIKDVGVKRRKLTREYGDVRFVPHVSDPAVLRELLTWKSAQYRRSGLVDVFSFAWTRALLERIHGMQAPQFAAMLSGLYAGDRLIAVHMGMRSEWVWNWWFPRHRDEFNHYSPGILLRVCAAEAADQYNIRRIDLGPGGDATYKPRLRSGAIPVATGSVELPSLTTVVRGIRRKTEAWVRRSPLLPLARIPGRLIVRLEGRRRFS